MTKETTTLTLAGQDYEIEAPAFKSLKKIIAAFNRLNAAGVGADEMLVEAAIIFSLLLNKEVADIEEMRIAYLEVSEAIKQVPIICGLVKKEAAPGEAQAGSL